MDSKSLHFIKKCDIIVKEKSMNKSELIAKVSLALNKEGDEVRLVFDKIVDEIVNQLRDGETVRIHGFGNFVPRPYGERKCYNPRTGETILLPASVQPAFVPGKKMRVMIQK